MKSLRNRLLTLLALTLFGGAGAWAQGPTQVTLLTTDMVADWQGVTMNVTLADLQALDLGFVAVDESVAQAWTGAPQEAELAYLIYGFSESEGYISFNYIMYSYGIVVQHGQSGFSKAGFYLEVRDYKVFYTGSPAIELTKSGANQWTLGQTPDYDLELQVEYYQPHALKDIPAGWQVKVNGVDKTAAIDHDSLMIVETDTVTLIPDNPRRVKSVTLVEPLQTLQIGGDVTGTFYYLPGETWRQAIQNHPTENNTSDEMNGWSVWGDPNKVWKGEAKLYSGGNPVDPDTAISSSLQYQLHW
jgi:hypothetical protein